MKRTKQRIVHIKLYAQSGALLKELDGPYNVICYQNYTEVCESDGQVVVTVRDAVVLVEDKGE